MGGNHFWDQTRCRDHRRSKALALGVAILGCGLLASCGGSDDAATGDSSALSQTNRKKTQVKAVPTAAPVTGNVTPMANRVAVIGVLNKRNNLTIDLNLRPGDSQRLGDIIVKLSACERTAPWEKPQETGAFVQVLRLFKADGANWKTVFSGWMFRNSPSLNVLEDRVYDVWVKDCIMAFPGEEDRPRPKAAAPSPAPSASPSAPATSAAPEDKAEEQPSATPSPSA